MPFAAREEARTSIRQTSMPRIQPVTTIPAVRNFESSFFASSRGDDRPCLLLQLKAACAFRQRMGSIDQLHIIFERPDDSFVHGLTKVLVIQIIALVVEIAPNASSDNIAVSLARLIVNVGNQSSRCSEFRQALELSAFNLVSRLLQAGEVLLEAQLDQKDA